MNTVIVAVITRTLRLADLPGNVRLSARASGLESDSVVNVTQMFTVDKTDLFDYVGHLSEQKIEQIDDGLKLVLSL